MEVHMPPVPERTGPLPLKTPLKEFAPYVAPQLLKRLTPATQAVTKRDLLLLAAGEFTPATKRLTVEDMHSLRTVFAQNSARQAKQPGGTTGGGRYYCCCCCCYFCCCCTAVSVTRPVATAIDLGRADSAHAVARAPALVGPS
jgi:hypothetical protein